MQPRDFCTHNLTQDCGACWAFLWTEDILSFKKINRGRTILDGFLRLCYIFIEFLQSVIVYLTWLWHMLCIEADVDAVKYHLDHVFFESANPTHCIKWQTGTALRRSCLVLCKLTKAENWWAFNAALRQLLYVKRATVSLSTVRVLARSLVMIMVRI